MKIPGLLAVSDNNGEEQGKISGKNNESKWKIFKKIMTKYFI